MARVSRSNKIYLLVTIILAALTITLTQLSLGDQAPNEIMIRVGAGLLIFFAALLISAGGLYFFSRFVIKDVQFDPEGIRYQPPEGKSVVYGYAVAEEEMPNLSRALVGVILDLAARGFYRYDNIRERDGSWQLVLAIADNRPGKETLDGCENSVMIYIDRLLKDGPCPINQLKERVDMQDSRERSYWRIVARALAIDAQRSSKNQTHYWPLLFITWLFGAAVLGVVAFASTGLGSASGPLDYGYAPLAVFIYIVTIFFPWALTVSRLPRSWFVKSRLGAAIDLSAWREYRDFIVHFDQMETVPALSLPLWDRAFATAVVWGVADQFSNRAMVVSSQQNNLAYSVPISWAGEFDEGFDDQVGLIGDILLPGLNFLLEMAFWANLGR